MNHRSNWGLPFGVALLFAFAAPAKAVVVGDRPSSLGNAFLQSPNNSAPSSTTDSTVPAYQDDDSRWIPSYVSATVADYAVLERVDGFDVATIGGSSGIEAQFGLGSNDDIGGTSTTMSFSFTVEAGSVVDLSSSFSYFINMDGQDDYADDGIKLEWGLTQGGQGVDGLYLEDGTALTDGMFLPIHQLGRLRMTSRSSGNFAMIVTMPKSTSSPCQCTLI